MGKKSSFACAREHVERVFTDKDPDWITGDRQRVYLTKMELLELIGFGRELGIAELLSTPEAVERFLATEPFAEPSPQESR